MDYDKQYVKHLISELEKCEKKLEEMGREDQSEVESINKEIEKLQKELESANKTNVELANELNEAIETHNKELDKEIEKNKELEKEIDKIKTSMKRPVISNTINIFEELKKGNIIKFIHPTRNANYNSFKENPFVFEMDGKGAIYVGDLVGMYEITSTSMKYYHNQKAPHPFGGEIMYQILGAEDKTFECRVKRGSGKGKKIQDLAFTDVLKMSPSINLNLKLFESDKYYKYIYTDKDGSEYIVKNHRIEYI